MIITERSIKFLLYNLFKYELYDRFHVIKGIDETFKKRYRINGNGKVLDLLRNKILKITKTADYPIVTLRDGKKSKPFRIHLLLANTFLKYNYINDNLEVDHIDRNKNNYKLENLRLVTNSENKYNRKFSETSYKYYKYWVCYSKNSSLKIIMGPILEEDLPNELKSVLVKKEIIYNGYFWKSYLTNEKDLFKKFSFDTEWKLIPNSNNSYCSKEGLILFTGRNTSPLITTGHTNDSGYKVVNIRNKLIRVHRIVYSIFGTENFSIDDKTLIDHIDTNRLNNNISNLKVVKNQKENLSNPITRKNLSKPVIKYSLDNRFLKRYNSIKEANIDLGVSINNSNIVSCCRGNQKTYKGFIWRYENSTDI